MTAAQARVLALTSVASLMVALDVLAVSTALAAIRVHLHVSLAEHEWTVNDYVLSLAVLLMTGAALGHRRLFTAGTGLFTAGSAACALAPAARPRGEAGPRAKAAHCRRSGLGRSCLVIQGSLDGE